MWPTSYQAVSRMRIRATTSAPTSSVPGRAVEGRTGQNCMLNEHGREQQRLSPAACRNRPHTIELGGDLRALRVAIGSTRAVDRNRRQQRLPLRNVVVLARHFLRHKHRPPHESLSDIQFRSCCTERPNAYSLTAPSRAACFQTETASRRPRAASAGSPVRADRCRSSENELPSVCR